MIELETERLLLRAPSPRDAADLYEYAQTGFVGPMAGWRPHVSLRESRRILKRYRECGYIYAVCSKADGGKMIGTAGLHPDEKRSEVGARMLGYAFHNAFWGRGYATEAAGTRLKTGSCRFCPPTVFRKTRPPAACWKSAGLCTRAGSAPLIACMTAG